MQCSSTCCRFAKPLNGALPCLMPRRVHVEGLHEMMPFSYGAYILMRPAFVTPAADTASPTEDDGFVELKQGEEVAVLEVVEVGDLNLV